MKNAIYMLDSVGGAQMNSFIITTTDDKLIVIDGGYKSDTEKLLSRLREISGKEKPHIDAWFLSHAHDDHITAFMTAIENHQDEFSCSALYYCFPSVQFIERHEAHEAHTIIDFYRLLPKFAHYSNIVTAGDSYQIGEAKFDILYTPDPEFTMNAINNSSTVFRMTLGEKTVLFLGDLGIEAGNKLLNKHGDKLKSDFCQLAHHGQNGVTRPVYETISPKACLWCTPLWLWNNDAGKGYNTHVWQTVIVRAWMDEIGAKEHYVIKDGDQYIEL